MIFIDELDGLCRKRVSTEEEYTRRMKTQLLREIENATHSNIFLLCATNCPWELDSAFLRRFQKQAYVSLPDRLQLQVLCKMFSRLFLYIVRLKNDTCTCRYIHNAEDQEKLSNSIWSLCLSTIDSGSVTL